MQGRPQLVSSIFNDSFSQDNFTMFSMLLEKGQCPFVLRITDPMHVCFIMWYSSMFAGGNFVSFSLQIFLLLFLQRRQKRPMLKWFRHIFSG